MSRKVVTEIISYLFILLFGYAAVTKLLDYQNFRIQVGQSPLLAPISSLVAWSIPSIELIVAIGLSIPAARQVSLYIAFGLMVMFTAYIVAILNFSDYVPCSCGGVLEKLGWTEHLVFNTVFILLAMTGVLISCNPGKEIPITG